MDEPKYKLYALKAGAMPSDTEFYFLLPDIDLVYTQEKPANAMEIDNPQQIPAEAREWLTVCIANITARWLKENPPVELKGSRTFMERLRTELEAEREKEAKNDGQ